MALDEIERKKMIVYAHKEMLEGRLGNAMTAMLQLIEALNDAFAEMQYPSEEGEDDE